MKLLKINSKSEQILVAVTALLSIALLTNVIPNSVYADDDEGSTQSTQSSDSNDDSDGGSTQSDDDSNDDSQSTQSADEESNVSVDEADDVSVKSAPDSMEMEKSLDDESVETSSDAADEIELSVSSVRSGVNVADIDNVEINDDNTAVVTEDERLLFIIPVKISKTLLLDEDGNVTEVRQSIIDKILSILSF